jgi:hypothetical protein
MILDANGEPIEQSEPRKYGGWPPIIQVPEDAKTSNVSPPAFGDNYRKANSNGYRLWLPDTWGKKDSSLKEQN